jgi:hypothetical protein
MNDAQSHPPAAEIERQLLSALCASDLDRQMRAEIIERLRAHTFADPDYEVIFRALAKMPPAPIARIHETLGARLTLLGFPDIDVTPILGLEPPSAKKIPVLLTQLGR